MFDSTNRSPLSSTCQTFADDANLLIFSTGSGEQFQSKVIGFCNQQEILKIWKIHLRFLTVESLQIIKTNSQQQQKNPLLAIFIDDY